MRGMKVKLCWAVILAILSLAQAGADQGLIILTDVNGRSIQARILDRTHEVVTVERFDGQIFDIPLTMLSKADVEFLKSWRPPPVDTVDSPEKAVVIIESDLGTGTGFFVTQRGRTYLYTNLHVIGDMRGLTVTDSQGKPVELGPLEVSASADLARFAVARRPALVFADTVVLDSDVRAYGNSAGGGVITVERGKVLGIAGHQFETSAKIQRGNSGGPIVDQGDNVVGVSTYATPPFNDALARGTRYAEVRRYALRPQMFSDWVAVTPADIARDVDFIRSKGEHLSMIIYSYIILRQGAGQVEIPDEFPQGLRQILVNHNARQRRPDTRYRYRDRGDFIVLESVSLAGQKNASLRANLRALARHVDSDYFDFRWHGAQFTSAFFQDLINLMEERASYVRDQSASY